MSELEEVIKELPPDLHQEVADFARFLMEKRGRKPKGRLKLDWRGAFTWLTIIGQAKKGNTANSDMVI